MTRIADLMSRDVRALSPNESLVAAAKAMEELDVGVIPVCDGDTLVGMVTDRDIVVRGLALELDVEAPLSEVMSDDPCWCFEDQSVDEVTEQMRDRQIRRMPVLDRQRHLVGIVSLGDVATLGDERSAGEALQDISQPSSSSQERGVLAD